MNTATSQDLNAKKAIRVVKKAVKEILTSQGIEASTRKGNKELDLLLKKLIKGNFVNAEQLKAMGNNLGQAIASVSGQRGVKHLDKQVIIHVALHEELEIPEAVPTSAAPKIVKQAATPVEIKRTTTVKQEEIIRAPEVEEVEEVTADAPDEVEAEEVEEVTADAPDEVEEEEAEEVEEVTADTPDEVEAEEVEEVTADTPDEVEAEEVEEVTADTPDEVEAEEVEEVTADTPDEVEEEEAEEVEEVTADTPDEVEAEEEEEEVEEEIIAEAKEEQEKKPNSALSLKDRIGEDIKLAMKAKDTIRLETVRGIKKALLEKEVSVRPQGQDTLTPEQELEVLSQQAKQRRDSIEQYQKAQREDLAEKEAQELAIIETYLPAQLSDDELQTILAEIITSTGATTVKDLGKVMGVAMQQLKGKADGKKIQELVKNQLS